MPGPRDYKLSTIKRLFALSYNQCYHPNCSNKLISEEDEKIILAKIAHIEAANSDGPRYRKSMSDDERRDFKNLILLCDEHHLIIDNKENEEKYPTDLLKLWKEKHEINGFKKSNIPLTKLPFETFCIGRENELEYIDEIFKTNDTLLLLNGMGGIGKTTLAKEYIKEFIGFYDHIAYVEYKDDIKTSFITAFNPHYKLESKTIDKKFDELLYKLQNEIGDNLLVIDNLQTQNDLVAIKDMGINFKLLVTSRVKFKNIKNYHVGTLSPEKAKELFLKSHDTDEDINQLLKNIGYHTLFITLTAQALENNHTLTIKTLEDKFFNGEFGDISNLDDDFEEKKFYTYLEELFKANNLKDKEILVLKRLSLFPSIDIEYELLKEFLCVNKEEEESFSLILNKLAFTGWLIKDKNTFKLHQIIKEFIVSIYGVTYEECNDIVEFFTYNLNKLYEKNPANAFLFIPYVINFINLIKDRNIYMGNFYNTMALIYKDLKYMDIALVYQKMCLEIFESELKENNLDIITLNNNMAMIYLNKGELDEALIYQKNAIDLFYKKKFDDENILSTCYNNLSLIYKGKEQFEEALKYQQKALTIRKKFLSPNDERIGISYNNIALIYDLMNEKSDAIKYQEKAVLIFEEKLSKNHPTLAKSYNALSRMYLKCFNIKKAKYFIDKALDIRVEIYPNGHPYLDSSLKIQALIDNSLKNSK